jgi:hypothetical protein
LVAGLISDIGDMDNVTVAQKQSVGKEKGVSGGTTDGSGFNKSDSSREDVDR